MILTKAAKRNFVLFAAAFFLCGVLRVLFYQTDFTFCFSQIFCSALTLLWAITVRKRVTDDRLRSLMLWFAVSLLLHFILQILRYDLFDNSITAQQIETRNAYIAEETRIKQERTEVKTRNRLYERVSSLVKPQLEQIDALINAPEGLRQQRTCPDRRAESIYQAAQQYGAACSRRNADRGGTGVRCDGIP